MDGGKCRQTRCPSGATAALRPLCPPWLPLQVLIHAGGSGEVKGYLEEHPHSWNSSIRYFCCARTPTSWCSLLIRGGGGGASLQSPSTPVLAWCETLQPGSAGHLFLVLVDWNCRLHCGSPCRNTGGKEKQHHAVILSLVMGFSF